MLLCVVVGGVLAVRPNIEFAYRHKLAVLVTNSEQAKVAPLLHYRSTIVVDGNLLPDTKEVPRQQANPKQHTLGHLACPACEASKKRAMQVNLAPSLGFKEAAEQWKNSRREQLSPGSLENYRQYIKSLNSFFGEMTLEQIHIGHVEEYQELRAESAGPSRINHEISTLQQILKRAGLWEEVRRYYEPLKLNQESIGIALESDEEAHLFKVAHTKLRWQIAYCCGLISNNTTAGPKEILRLRLGDLFLSNDPPCLQIVQGIKNKYRVRTIPLNHDALWAVRQLLELADRKGSYLPNHYLIPGRPKRLPPGADRHKAHFDPLTPAKSYRRAWESLRKEAGKKFPRLLTIRRYDLRHNACTKLLEDPRIAERTIEEMMGHKLNSRTKERYSHIRMQKKLAAVEILEAGHTGEPKKKPQAVEKLASSTAKYFFPIS